MTDDEHQPHRRAVLFAATAGASSLAGCGNAPGGPFADDGTPRRDPDETEEPRLDDDQWMTGDQPLIRLVAHADGWRGQGPDERSDVENPTLPLEEGTTYEIVRENRDGERHQLKIADGAGEVVASTAPAEEQGVTQSVEFTAGDDIAEYYCEYHPEAMRGEIEVGRTESDGNGSGE